MNKIVGQQCPCCAATQVFGVAMTPDEYKANLEPTGYELCQDCGDELLPIEESDQNPAAPGAWPVGTVTA